MISDWLAQQLLNATLRNTAFTTPATVYIALYTSNPTKADTGTEVTGGAYVRQAVTMSAPTVIDGSYTVRNTSDVPFPVATANWGTLTHFGIRTAATGGNLLYFAPLENSRSIVANDRFTMGQNKALVRFIQP
ncbi:hypothetical protein ACFOQM_23250 [Paenibacillus sp. GCM10012307]|uniref:Uncharacterized protein n=1 Tax=Paenibacillus roseus TaxID=2798579 RepID=A0A934J3M7_9BACL|nr:hypothetical protein [Paenibacillus roseus]MBJ6364142.1 hypothetical protein [Paenibacillus roseus]